MTGLDTNLLVRFLTRDDEDQAQKVYALFREAEEDRREFFVPLVVLLELIWVLGSAYGIDRERILDAIQRLLQMPVLKFEQVAAVQAFLAAARGDATDLSDLLIGHSAVRSGCRRVLTFDRRAARTGLFDLIG